MTCITISVQTVRLFSRNVFGYDGRYMNTTEAARLLGTSEQVIRKAIRAGHVVARPRGLGPRSGYVVDVDSLQRWALSKGRLLGSRLPAEGESTEAVFIESAAPLLPDLPIPKLPPVRGSARDLIAYAGQCQRLAEAALSRAARMIEEGGIVDVI